MAEVEFGHGKRILAPMVRVGTLPFRLLALEHGCDIVYSEEIIDRSIQRCVRVENERLGLVEFIHETNKKKIFQTCAVDYPVTFQMGSADPINALKAATVVSRDVDCFDLNMGCPKHFSISGGMGAALLDKPQRVKEILTTLKRNLPNQITAKIRLKPTTAETVDLLKLIEGCGVSAIAVHARTRDMRRGNPALWEEMKRVVDAAALSVPIILNGDVKEYADIDKAIQATGCDSVMIARGAINNPLIFSPPTDFNELNIMRQYVQHIARFCGMNVKSIRKSACFCICEAVDVEMPYQNTKYTTMQMFSCYYGSYTNDYGKRMIRSKSMREICSILGMEDYIDEHERKAAAWENSQIVGNSRESLIDESIEDERIGEKEAGSVGDG